MKPVQTHMIQTYKHINHAAIHFNERTDIQPCRNQEHNLTVLTARWPPGAAATAMRGSQFVSGTTLIDVMPGGIDTLYAAFLAV